MTLNSAIWFITYKCNYKCPYCWEADHRTDIKTVDDLDAWVAAWNRLKPKILDITGGEPTLVKWLPDLIHRLESPIRVAMTTNLSFNTLDYIQKIPPNKLISLTLSWHPTQEDINVFIGKVLLLKNNGYNYITINYVAYPEQMYLTSNFKELFTSMDVRFHVDPYAQIVDRYTFTVHDKEYLKPFIDEDRENFFSNDAKTGLCSAGVDHIVVQPDGSVYRCVNEYLEHNSIGNILDSDFKLLKVNVHCKSVDRCAGCDRDKVTIFSDDLTT